VIFCGKRKKWVGSNTTMNGCEKCYFCRYLELNRDGSYKARGVVAKAVKIGVLSKPKKFKCVGCGRQAQCYDHRDYNEPLTVDPVCFSCNSRRAPAVLAWFARDDDPLWWRRFVSSGRPVPPRPKSRRMGAQQT
jgi:hypothetical protein